MWLQPISYRGRFVAAATRERFFLCDELRHRAPGDGETTFVCFMCLYARDVLRGELPGPYSDEQARRFARAALIPSELAERGQVDLERAAAALSVPPSELAEERRSSLRGVTNARRGAAFVPARRDERAAAALSVPPSELAEERRSSLRGVRPLTGESQVG